MQIDINDQRVIQLMDRLIDAGAQVRCVGGAVRDLVADLPYDDVDLATDFLPEHVSDVFEAAGFDVIPTGLKHGTITVVCEGEPYEITTLRADLETDGRHATVGFVTDFRQDAERRDFTINALSADRYGKVYDYFDGLSDLKNGIVRFVGDANSRVQEDYLRILRYFRFRGRFGSGDDAAARDAIGANASGLQIISVERIWKEVSKIFQLADPIAQLSSMQELGVNEQIGLPFSPHHSSMLSRLRHEINHPAVMLGALVSRPDEAEALAFKWRLSSRDRHLAVSAATVAADANPDPHYWRVQQFDGLDAKAMRAVLSATGRSEASSNLFEDVPDFPVRGRDLIALGIAAGPTLGTALKELEDIWKTSKFSLSIDDLLQIVREQQNGEALNYGI